jgi:hypothetical protein
LYAQPSLEPGGGYLGQKPSPNQPINESCTISNDLDSLTFRTERRVDEVKGWMAAEKERFHT